MKSISVFRSCLLVIVAVILTAGIQLSFVTTTHADPVWGEIFTIKQPDGTRVQVRIWGDEFYRVVESLEGYTLVRDSYSGEICYARLSSDGDSFVSTGIRYDGASGAALGLAKHLRIDSESRRAIIQDKRDQKLADERKLSSGPDMPQRIDAPCNGDVEGICLIIDFSDEVATIAVGDIDNYCNQVGYTGYGNNGSVRDYFYAVSDGNLTYTNYVPASYFRAPKTKAYYDDCDAPYGQRAREMIIAALEDLDSGGFDFSQYDSNGDGYVDAINCFYTGVTGCAWANGLWPHSGGILWQKDGVTVNRYQVTGLGTSLRLATFCHENGHMICFWPDLYDYDHDSNGVGKFCVMCNYTSSTNPQEPCAYLKYIAGWTTTTLLTAPQTGLTVPSTSNTIYKFEHPVYSNEYYLIENRQKAGRDIGLPDAGIAIWHIDTDGDSRYQDMTPSRHYEATLVQADGNWDLEYDVNNGDATDLWSAPGYVECSSVTNPNTDWWAGDDSDLRITGISASSSLMTFDFFLCTDDADFTSDVTVGCAPLTVNFTDLSTGPVTSWKWYFGDGDSSTVQHPSHIYTEAGTLTVTLETTSAACTVMKTKTDYIVVPAGGYCSVAPSLLDFGSVATNDTLDLPVTIRNDGCGVLNGDVSGSCFNYSILSGDGPFSLPVGDSVVVTVRFTPTFVGTFPCTIETGTSCANVECLGYGITPPPICQIDPDTLDFGEVVYPGGFGLLSFDITNTGYGTLEGTVSEGSPDYQILSGATYALTHGQAQSVQILFMPSSAGLKECLVDTDSQLCSDVFCTAVATSPAECQVFPDTLHFGTIALSDSVDQEFMITNTGGDVLSGAVVETCDYYELVSGGGAYALATGETLHVTVRFKPTVDGNHECGVDVGNAGCAGVYCEGTGSSLVGAQGVVPGKLTLYQNHPNPFNPATTIAFWLPERSSVTLAIYDVDGRLVNALIDQELDMGMTRCPWNGTDSKGNRVSSGVYFYKLTAGGRDLTKKMVLLK